MKKSILLLLVLLLVGFVFAYVAPNQDNVILTLETGYTAPNQDNIVLTLVRETPIPGENFNVTNSPNTVANSNYASGTVDWTNPEYANKSDNNYASASLAFEAKTNYLKASEFGFNIPADATINGIIVEIEKWRDNTAGARTVFDAVVSIVKNDTVGSENKADTTTDYPTSDPDSYISYGASNDLWGETWTPADINNETFGAVLVSTAGAGFPSGEPRVDHIKITVHYTAVVPTDTCTYSGSGDWIIDCEDACVLTTPTTVSGALYITNYTEGEYIKIYTNITAQDFFKDNTCYVYVDDTLGDLLIN